MEKKTTPKSTAKRRKRTLNMKIGPRVIALRVARGYSRIELAEKVGISCKFLYEIEGGKKGFSADTLFQLSRVLRASMDYIMTGSEFSDSEYSDNKEKI